MQTQVMEKEEKLDEGDELFVIVLVPKLGAFGVDKPLDLDLCGLSMEAWVDTAVGAYPHMKIEAQPTDDIITLVKRHATEHKYTAVVYADMPLLRGATIESALQFAKTFRHKAVRLVRGWLFETEHIKSGRKVEPVSALDLPQDDFVAVYNFSQLARATKIMRNRINEKLMSEGVHIIDPDTTYIDATAQIDAGAVIEPNTVIRGKVEIGSGSRVGPFAQIRTGTYIGQNCRVGNFVELKNATLGDGTKVAHLAYIGDATVGESCNIGCGVVVCNFDGKKKHHTTIGDNVFVGSNVNLVAPVTLESNSIIAAGSTVTHDVPSGALAIARARQENKEDWLNRKSKTAPEPVIEPEPEPEIVLTIEPEPVIEEIIEEVVEELTEIPVDIIEEPKPEKDRARTASLREQTTRGVQTSFEIKYELKQPEPDPEPEEIEELEIDEEVMDELIEEIADEDDEKPPTPQQPIEIAQEIVVTDEDEKDDEDELDDDESTETQSVDERVLFQDFEDEEDDEEGADEKYVPPSGGFDWDKEGDDLESFYQPRG